MPPIKQFRSRQRGLALVTALLVVALATIAATALMVAENVAVHRSSNLRFGEQAWWYAAGVENWIGEILKDDREQGEVDDMGENWARPVDYLPIEGGFVRGQIIDQQGCINLNNLVGAKADSTAAQFQRLLGLLEGADSYNAPALVQSIQDWIDPDMDTRFPGGAEDGVYSGSDFPYRAANRPLQSPSELLLVQGITRELYQILLPHVCVLPPGTTINVNTASAAVLASLAAGLTMADGEALVQHRTKDPFQSVQEFRLTEQMTGRQVDESTLSVSTQYFLLTGEVHVGTGQVNLYSLFLRDQNGTSHLLVHSKDAY